MRLHNKVAIVTNGGAGMGLAVAQAYATEGARIVVAEINQANGEAAVQSIRGADGQAIFAQTDVADTGRWLQWWPPHGKPLYAIPAMLEQLVQAWCMYRYI